MKGNMGIMRRGVSGEGDGRVGQSGGGGGISNTKDV